MIFLGYQELLNQVLEHTFCPTGKYDQFQLRDQADYSDATARQKAMQYESAGYRVPQLRQVNFEQTYGGGNQAPTTQGQPSGGTYQIDQIITKGNKKYRITGLSDPNDPDVEEVK